MSATRLGLGGLRLAGAGVSFEKSYSGRMSSFGGVRRRFIPGFYRISYWRFARRQASALKRSEKGHDSSSFMILAMFFLRSVSSRSLKGNRHSVQKYSRWPMLRASSRSDLLKLEVDSSEHFGQSAVKRVLFSGSDIRSPFD